MADALMKILPALLVAAFASSGVRLLVRAISSGWRLGRCVFPDKNQSLGHRVIRSWRNPINFWLTMMLAHVLLSLMLAVIGGCVYVIWFAICRSA